MFAVYCSGGEVQHVAWWDTEPDGLGGQLRRLRPPVLPGDSGVLGLPGTSVVDPDPYSIRTQELSESTLGWVKNSIKNLKLSTLQVVVKPFYQNSWEENKKKYFFAQMACEFAWIFEYLQVMQSEIC